MSVKTKKAPGAIVLQWTHVHPIDPKECGKTFELGENGELICESIPHLNKSEMTLMTGASLEDFVEYLNDVDPGDATIYGIPGDLDKMDEENTVTALSRTDFSKASDQLKARAITRTLEDIASPDGPGIMLLDYDPAPGEVPLTEGDLIGMVMSATSGAGQVKVISGSSSSSHIINES